MKAIICLSNESWQSSPGRTRQLISRLRDTKILYFSPASSPRDRRWREAGRKVRPNVTEFVLPPLLIRDERLSPLFRIGQQKLGRFIREQAQRQRMTAPLLWVTSPTYVHLLDHLEYSGLVYDCDRVWDELPGPWEGTLAHTADIVFAASPGLRDRLAPCSSNIALLPNGVHFPLFSRHPVCARRSRSFSGPVLGWIGTIHADLDLSPLLYAARLRPDWNFLLLGQQVPGNPWLPALRKLDNVALVDRCTLPEVPDYMDRCDILLNFLRDSQPYSDVIPVRLYEYLSTGKPIVSMLWPEQVEHYPDVIYGAKTSAELVRLCHQALSEDRGWVSSRRRDYGAAAAWSIRGEEVQHILTTAGLL